MIAVDGAQQSGSGTIVRYAVALAALLGRPVRVFNARKRRRSQLTVTPAPRGLQPVSLVEPGVFREVHGIALSSHLAERHVSDRMASVCEDHLMAADLSCSIERIDDTTAPHAGASLAIWAESTTGCRLGADRAGGLARSSEAIGQFVAKSFLQDLWSGATVDRHVADQLVLFAALAHGTSRYIVPRETEHLATNLWLIGQFGVHGVVERRQVVIEGLGLGRAQTTEGVSVRQPAPIA